MSLAADVGKIISGGEQGWAIVWWCGTLLLLAAAGINGGGSYVKY